MRRRSTPALPLLTFVLTAACAPGVSDDAARADADVADLMCWEAPPAVEVGSGLSAHTPLEAGDAVHLLESPRGGWYLPVSLRVHNCGDIVSVHTSLVDIADGSVLSDGEQRMQLVDRGVCTGELWGVEAWLDPELDVARLEGADVELLISIEDLDGRVATSSVVLIAVLGADKPSG